MFNNAVNFLQRQCGATIVFCTATQPLLHRVDAGKGAAQPANDAELVPDVPLFAALRRTVVHNRVRQIPWEHSEVADLAVAEASAAGSCLVVVNTKAEARSLYEECRQRAGGIPVVHLSTNLCPAHRKEKFRQIKEHLRYKQPLICVSTQLIEAGVDLSFGAAIRALAGLDSVAQTAGRCNRHGEVDLGHVYIVNLKGEVPAALAEIRKAQEVAGRILRECGETVDLGDVSIMNRYSEYYFFERARDMDYPVAPPRAERNDTLLCMLSDNGKAVEESKDLKYTFTASFKTAAKLFEPIESSAQGVIVPYGEEGRTIIAELAASYEAGKQFQLLRRAQQYSVNVFPHVLRSLQSRGALHQVQDGSGVLYLDERYYNDDFGLDAEGTAEMEAIFA